MVQAVLVANTSDAGTTVWVILDVLDPASGELSWWQKRMGSRPGDEGRMLVDGREIYSASDLKVGLFTSTEDF